MNNEDKIVELLAESLKNQDIQSEKLSSVTEKLSSVTEKLDSVTEKLDSLVDVVKDVVHALQHQSGMLEKLIAKYDKVDDLEHRLFLLEKKLGKAE
jgi:ABC-type transporter Mla subunit MlaD